MDGASKYVRGDAIAGLLILFINIGGGFIIGVVQHGLSASQAADSYILLAVGDAPVAQSPALLIAVSAVMLVSRVGEGDDVGSQIRAQLFNSPRLLAVTAAIIGALGLIPGMPNLVFLAGAGGIGWGAWVLRERDRKAPAARPKTREEQREANPEASWDDLTAVDTLGTTASARRNNCAATAASSACRCIPRMTALRSKICSTCCRPRTWS